VSRTRIKLDNGNDEHIKKFIEISEQEGKPRSSIAQYTSRMGQFARWLGRDVLTATKDDLTNWMDKGNDFKKNHITAFYKTFLTNNVAGFQDRIDRSLLLYLVVH